MKLVSGIVDSGFFAQSALSAEVATKDSLGRNISETYLTGVDLTPYQTTAGMTAYQSAGEYYSASNPSGFLVADDITGKLDASVYAADSGNFLTAVPDTYLQNTDLSTEDGKVTAISGIPLSAGGEVPEGVMVESGLEYNAVNEISGYNGSAIAQYGAEKQWLQHDDTIVHVSNSAQYAFGVNLSAVAQLLGVDETVLWENNGTLYAVGQIINFNESPSAFEKLEIMCGVDIQSPECVQFEYHPGNIVVTWHEFFNNQFRQWMTLLNVQDNGATAVSGQVYFAGLGANSTFTAYNQGPNWEYNFRGIQKIIGIGRKA